MKTVTLNATVKSNSHNAPYTSELGNHWPTGQKFRTFPASRERSLRVVYRIPADSRILQQVGGEEVLLVVSEEEFNRLFT